jgi:hypothetical protein
MSKIQNPIEDYEFAGIKTVGSYDYYLMVDGDGNAVIVRNATDDSETKFNKMKIALDATFSERETAIDAYWTSPADASKIYKYIFQI